MSVAICNQSIQTPGDDVDDKLQIVFDVQALMIAALGLPVLAALIPGMVGSRALARRSLPHGWIGWLQLFLWLITAACFLLLQARPAELALGSWAPSSVLRMPLIFRSDAPGIWLLLIVLATLMVSWAVRGSPGYVDAFVLASLAMLALANSWPAVMIAIGASDLTTALSPEAGSNGKTRARQNLFNAVGSVLLVLGLASHLAADGSAYLPLTQLNLQSSHWINLAIGTRILAAFFVGPPGRGLWSFVAGFLLLATMRSVGLAQPGLWLQLGFAILALPRLIGAFARSSSQEGVEPLLGGLAILLISLLSAATPREIVHALGGILIGFTLLHTSRNLRLGPLPIGLLLRGLGAVNLIAIPLTPLFAAWASSAAFGTQPGLLLLLAQCACQLFVAASVLRLTLRDDQDSHHIGEVPSRIVAALLGVIGLVVMQLVLFNMGPGLLAISGANWAAGLPWVLATMLGAMIGVLATTKLTFVENLRIRGAQLPVADVIDFSWLSNIVSGALRRITAPFPSVFVFLESDGALLWAIMVVLVGVLISRPGSP